MQKQITLKAPFSVQGKGLHTGQFINAVFLPAEENYGYKIQRVDIEGQPVIECSADFACFRFSSIDIFSPSSLEILSLAI